MNYNRPYEARAGTRRAFLGLLGSGLAGGVAVGGGAAGAARADDAQTVAVGSDYFDPVGLHVQPGTTVRFAFESGSHSATAYPGRIPDAATPFDTGVLSGGSVEHTVETPGTYDYYCVPHESTGMVGRIVVDEPGGPAEDGPIPHGAVPESDAIVEQGSIGTVAFGPSEGDGGQMGDSSGRGMGPGGGKMGDGGHGGPPSPFLPVGVATAGVGAIGGIAYWLSGRGSTADAGGEASLDTLERRFERGDISEAEFERRRDRLTERADQ
jgi:plastocyanin